MIRTIYLLLLLNLIFAINCSNRNSQKDYDKLKEYAFELQNKGLYKNAIEVYKEILSSKGINNDTQANINYIIANLYMDRLSDYENALAYYIKVKTLYPDSKLIKDINPKVIECLERLNRTIDAQNELRSAVDINADKTNRFKGSLVIARVGDREITDEELNYEINKLPPQMQQIYQGKDGKLNFLKQFIIQELLYNSAKRKNYDKSPDVIEKLNDYKRGLMVERVYNEEIRSRVNIDNTTKRLYYDAHKNEFTENKDGKEIVKPYEQVEKSIEYKLQQQKEQELIQKFLQDKLTAEEVKIYEDLLR